MKLSIIKSTVLISLIAVGMAGCLKDKAFDNGEYQSVHGNGGNVIELKVTASSNKNFVVFAVDNVNKDTSIAIVPVTLATGSGAPDDINVTLALSQDSLDAYNDRNGTGYEIPTSSQVTILNANNVVTIPKGSNVGYLKVKFNPSAIIGKALAFPFVISKIDKSGYEISGNHSSAVVNVLTKNAYDGIYKVTGVLVDDVNNSLSSTPGDPYPFEAQLQTTGNFSNVMWIDGAGDAHLIAGGRVYGSFAPVFTVDPATNKITSVVNSYGQPSGNNRSAVIDGSYPSRYDPATKTFYVMYYMYQAGSKRTTFNDTLTYVGPR